jgi:BON domain
MGLLDNATKPLQRAGSVGRFATHKGLGLVSEARSRFRRSGGDLNDPTIARKVESEVFRSTDVDKGKINVNVVDGVVFLRGTAKNPAQVKSIEAAARKVPEVVDVQNLLHLPKTPARMAKKQTRTDPADKLRTHDS